MRFAHILLILICFCGASCQRSSHDAASRNRNKVRISLQPIPTYAPMWVARHKGWMDEALSQIGNAKASWSVMRDGPLQNEAFAAGVIDIAFTADTPALIGRAAGLDTQIVGLAAKSPQCLAILVPSGSTIKSVKDLKGKKLAATKGSFCHHFLALALAQNSLSLDDIRFLNMAGPEINTSLQAGQIDAGVTWEPYISQLTSSNVAKVLIDGTGLKQGHEVIVATSHMTESSPETIAAVKSAYQKGLQYIQEHPQEAAQLIESDMKLTPALLVSLFSKIEYFPTPNPSDIDDFRATQEFLHKLGIIKQPVDVDAFTQFTITSLEKSKQEPFVSEVSP